MQGSRIFRFPLLSLVGVSCFGCVSFSGGLGFFFILFLFFPPSCWEFLFGVVSTALISKVLEVVGVDLVGALDVVTELLGCPEDCFYDGVLIDPMIPLEWASRGLAGS